jgi:hypothetical protein
VSDFPQKHFEGNLYDFGHLAPRTLQIPIADPPGHIDLYVTFGWHCFTEGFDPLVHQDHHRYRDTVKGVTETRAFDLARHECSLQLPTVVQSMLRGRIYHSQESYTYVAHIELATAAGLQQPYSVFFSLEKDALSATPAVRMYVKSAYLKPLVAKPNAQTWRFVQLAGEISGAFQPKAKKAKPQKKKAP